MTKTLKTLLKVIPIIEYLGCKVVVFTNVFSQLVDLLINFYNLKEFVITHRYFLAL